MKAKPKKSRSLSLVKGAVREIHFKIGGDIPTVKEIPVKSLEQLYPISLTDQHRGTEVQRVTLKGFILIDRTYLPGKIKVSSIWFATPAFCGLCKCMKLHYLTLNKLSK